MLSRIGGAIAALAVGLLLVLVPPAGAQQASGDGAVNPTASSVKEDQLFQELNRISGRCPIASSISPCAANPFSMLPCV